MIAHPHASTEPRVGINLSASGFHPIAPCIGHVLVTVAMASPGLRQRLPELADPAFKVIDSQTVDFETPQGG